jgi:hypothetical protein
MKAEEIKRLKYWKGKEKRECAKYKLPNIWLWDRFDVGWLCFIVTKLALCSSQFERSSCSPPHIEHCISAARIRGFGYRRNAYDGLQFKNILLIIGNKFWSLGHHCIKLKTGKHGVMVVWWPKLVASKFNNKILCSTEKSQFSPVAIIWGVASKAVESDVKVLLW